MAMSIDEMNAIAKKVGLSLHTKAYTTGEDWFQLFRQTSGERPPEVDFSGTKLNVMIYLLGYQAGWLAVSVEKTKLKKRIFDAVEET